MGEIFTAALWQDIVAKFMLFVPKLLTSLLVLLLFWLGGLVLKNIIHRIGQRRNLDPDILNLLEQAAQLTVLTFGIITALGTLGIEVTALVAGLGLTGFALGFALKDIISNFLSGILILIYHPFDRGDHISVSGSEGTVASIDLRYTVLHNPDKTILIPNSQLFTNTINITRPKENSPAAAPNGDVRLAAPEPADGRDRIR